MVGLLTAFSVILVIPWFQILDSFNFYFKTFMTKLPCKSHKLSSCRLRLNNCIICNALFYIYIYIKHVIKSFYLRITREWRQTYQICNFPISCIDKSEPPLKDRLINIIHLITVSPKFRSNVQVYNLYQFSQVQIPFNV